MTVRLALVGALLVAGCGAVTDVREGDAPAEAGDRPRSLHLVPSTYAERDHVVLPVTFTDGTRAELIYPPRLAIAELGAVPYASGRLRGESPTPLRGDVVGRDFRIFRGELDDVLTLVNGGRRPRLLARYEGAAGATVGFWSVPVGGLQVDYLGFQFGRWAVLVYDYASNSLAAMTGAERAAWSASFSGRETPGGFLVLDADPPLRLAAAGEHAGPELLFGSVEPARSLTLYPGPCKPHEGQTRVVGDKPVQWGGKFANWCLSDSMRAHATGTDAFVGGLIRDLRVRPPR